MTESYCPMSWCLPNWVDVNQTTHFEQWSEVFGPESQLGGAMSALVAPLDLNASSSGVPIRGYGEVEQKSDKGPFAAEDILLITDGSCTSTCTIFAELMKTLGGVKSLVFGGRPNPGPMQAIGGSKGNQVAYIQDVVQLGEVAKSAASSEEMRDRLDEIFISNNASRVPFSVAAGTINFKSAYRRGVDEVLLQFMYEAADYRRFYTYENVLSPASIWADAARAWWGDGGCVEGSMLREL